MMNHMSAYGACQVPNSTGVAWMGMIVQHYILHEHAKHSPDRMWMPSRVPHQHCSLTVISESFSTQHSEDFWFKLDKDAKAAKVQSLQQQPRQLFMEVIHQLVCWLYDSLNAHGDYLVARIIHIQFGLKRTSYHDLIGHGCKKTVTPTMTPVTLTYNSQ